MADRDKREMGLRGDKQWAQLEGWLCRISNFQPLGGATIEHGIVVAPNIKTFPYAVFDIESTRVPKNIQLSGFCTHKQDFEDLWDAFNGGYYNQETEEVLMIWSCNHYKTIVAKLLSVSMPKMVIMICKKGTFDAANYKRWSKNDATGSMLERYDPRMVWVPEIMRTKR